MTFSDCFWILGVGLVVLMPPAVPAALPRKPTNQPVMESH